MTLLMLLLTLAVVAGVIAVATGVIRGGLDEPAPTIPARALPADGITGRDIASLRFVQGLRGYRMDQVDAALDALAVEVDRLRAQVAQEKSARVQLARGHAIAPGGPGAGDPSGSGPGTGAVPTAGPDTGSVRTLSPGTGSLPTAGSEAGFSGRETRGTGSLPVFGSDTGFSTSPGTGSFPAPAPDPGLDSLSPSPGPGSFPASGVRPTSPGDAAWGPGPIETTDPAGSFASRPDGSLAAAGPKSGPITRPLRRPRRRAGGDVPGSDGVPDSSASRPEERD